MGITKKFLLLEHRLTLLRKFFAFFHYHTLSYNDNIMKNTSLKIGQRLKTYGGKPRLKYFKIIGVKLLK